MANWPFSDITPNDIARFAARGQWSKVAKAARLASRKAALSPLDHAVKLLSAWPTKSLALYANPEGDLDSKTKNLVRQATQAFLQEFPDSSSQVEDLFMEAAGQLYEEGR